ncbi:MAG: hypothetical protein R6X32_18465 [Chloroflexota bacterium]
MTITARYFVALGADYFMLDCGSFSHLILLEMLVAVIIQRRIGGGRPV